MATPQHEVPEQPSSGVSYPGVALVIALLAGAVLLPQLPFQGTRPTPDEAEVRYRHLVGQHTERVLARLWEDPFSAVARHMQGEMAPTSKDSKSPGASAHHHLKPEIGKTSRKAIVVAAMVPGGPYPEDVEARLRARSAVLAGLRVSGFTPGDAEHILFYSPNKEKRSETVALPETVPYEWFRETTGAGQTVLLLWLDENTFTRPLRSIVELYHQLSEPKTTPKLKIIGPSSSSTLAAMVNEVSEIKGARGTPEDTSLLDTLPHIEFYSATATAPDELLLANLHWQGRQLPSPRISSVFSDLGSQFIRTSPTDDRLIELLVDELKLRRVDPVCSGRQVDCYRDSPTPYCGRLHHIALISEWDTFYGRALPQTFAENVSAPLKRAAPDDASACGRASWVHRFSYLRGLDGQLPGARSPTDPDASDKAPRKTQDAPRGNTQVMERPIGRSQFDYLRRLARQVQELDHVLKRHHEGELKAIGILGSDVYDKLLILQALRGHFPNAIFFTTDLDALFLHPDAWPYTRNLLVASAFGLQLAPALQRDMPPFRGSYQTAMFFATLIAFRYGGEPEESPGEWQQRLLPRMYEIGRSQPVDLTHAPDLLQTDEQSQWRYRRLYQLGRQWWVARQADPYREEGYGTRCALDKPAYACLTELTSIHPGRPPSVPDGPTILFLLFGTLSAYTLAYASSWRVRRITTSAVDHVGTFLQKGGIYRWIGLMVVVVVLMLSMEALTRVILEGDRGEPFTIVEGVSVWPTESLRLVAAVLSVVFTPMVWFERDFDRNAEKFFPTFPPTMPPLDGRRKTLFERWTSFTNDCRIDRWHEPMLNDRVDAQRLWEELTCRRQLRCGFCRIVLMLSVYFAFALVLMNIYGRLSVPCRGEACFLVDTFILIVSVVCVSVLLFSVVDSIRLHTRWSDLLSRRESQWPCATLNECNQRFGFENPAHLSDWLDVDLIADRSEVIGRHIYYPFIVLFLMFAARYPLFDDWKTPTGLVIVMALSTLYMVSAAYRLRRAAEQCRQRNVARLWEKLVSVTGQGAQATALKEQLEMLTHEIMAIQRGAFRPLGQQPFLRAMLILLGGSGGLVILQYLPLANL